jgi:hypothetical protein
MPAATEEKRTNILNYMLTQVETKYRTRMLSRCNLDVAIRFIKEPSDSLSSFRSLAITAATPCTGTTPRSAVPT